MSEGKSGQSIEDTDETVFYPRLSFTRKRRTRLSSVRTQTRTFYVHVGCCVQLSSLILMLNED